MMVMGLYGRWDGSGIGNLSHDEFNVDLSSIVIVELVILDDEHGESKEVLNQRVIGTTESRAVFSLNCTSNADAIDPRYLHGLDVNVKRLVWVKVYLNGPRRV